MKKIGKKIFIVFALMILVGAILTGVGVSHSIKSGEMASARDAVLSFLKDNKVLTEGSEGSIMIRIGDKSVIFSKDGSINVLDNDTGVFPEEFTKDRTDDDTDSKSLSPYEDDDSLNDDLEDKTDDGIEDKNSFPWDEPDAGDGQTDIPEDSDSYDYI